MAQAAGERVAYFNGQIVPERDVRVPFRDRGFKYGDAVFDTTRTFGHRIFRLREHLDRLYRSLRYLRIDPGIGLDELQRITEEVLAKNLPLLEPDDDYWVTQRVSRGLDPSDRATFGQSGPTVIVECLPLPLRERATLYRDGIRVVVPSVRRAAARQPERPDQDEQLPERRPGRPRGEGPRPRGLGHPAGRQRQPGRGDREQRVPRPGRRDLHAARAVRPPRRSAGRRPSTWRGSSATPSTSGTSTSSTPTTPTRRSSRRPASASARCGASTGSSSAAARSPAPSPAASSRRTAAWSTTTSSAQYLKRLER